MLGHFGFSYIGLIYVLMLWFPNARWAKNKPKGYDSSGENKVLLVFERVGQGLCVAAVLLFTDYEPQAFTPWMMWFVISAMLMVLYEINWFRYFKSEQTVEDFYRPLLGVPAPGAVLPVVAFLLLGVYGRVIWLILAAIILGIGHIGIHLQHIKELKKKNEF